MNEKNLKPDTKLKKALDDVLEEDVRRYTEEGLPNAPDFSLKSEKKPKKKRPLAQYISLAAAACILLCAGFAGGRLLPSDGFAAAGSDSGSKDINTADMAGNEWGMIHEENLKENLTDSPGSAVSPHDTDVKIEEGTQEISTADVSRKLITTYDISSESLDFDTDTAQIEALVTALGGYIEDSSFNDGSRPGDSRSVRYTLRIPSLQADGFLAQVNTSLHIIGKTTVTEDITLEYYDTVSRLESYRTELDTLNRLMKEAESISDVLEIESCISDLSYTIDRTESHLRSMDNQVDYTTVRLSVKEVAQTTETGEESISTRIANGFRASVHSLCTGAADLLVWTASNIILLLLAAAVITLIICLIRRKHKKQ